MTFSLPKVQTGEWKRLHRSAMPSTMIFSDGRRMHRLGSGRIVMLGGWNASAVFDFGAAGYKNITNEVWYSDDEGSTWSLSANTNWEDTNRSTTATRFAPQHCALSCVYQGDVVVIGAEESSPGGRNQEVWKSSNGTSWSKVTITGTAPPTSDRIRAMCGTLGSDIYIMGGYLPGTQTFSKNVWKSSDGGASWSQLSDASIWPGGIEMVYSPVEHNGMLYVVGGGQYDGTTKPDFNGVWAFDGSSWTEVLANGHTQFIGMRFHQVLSLHGRLWALGGYNQNTTGDDLNRAIYSDDNGANWHEFPGGIGYAAAHAQAACTTPSRILMISTYGDRTVYTYERTDPSITPPTLTSTTNWAPATAGGTTAYLSGSGFTGVTSVEGSSAFTVDSDTQISVTFAAHAAGQVQVWVTHPTNGRSNALTVTYA